MSSDPGADVFLILLAIFLPPVVVALKTGRGVDVGVNLLLTLLGWIPGVLHAWYIVTRRGRPTVTVIKERPSSSSKSGHRKRSSRRRIDPDHGHARHRSRSRSRSAQRVYIEPASSSRRRSGSQRRYYR